MPEQLFDIRRRAVLSRSAMSRSVFSDDDDDDARADASGDRARWLATTSIGAARAEASWASLTRLDLRANGLTTLKGVESCERLRAIDVSENRLTTLDELRACGSTLRVVVADGNAISSVKGLGRAMTRLRTLSLKSNAFADARVDGFPALRMLDLSDNCLMAMVDCSTCVGLRVVVYRENAIASLEGIERLTPATITDLDVGGNDFADVQELRFLRYFPRLANLRFRGNPIDARAHHYGYDARAVAKFCAPSLRTCDGAAALGSSWALAASRLFRNDAGELSEPLLSMLKEQAPPWVLGEYLHSVCAPTDSMLGGGFDARRRSSAGDEQSCSMFSVSSFVPVNARRENGDDTTSSLDSEDDVDASFMVEGARLYPEDPPLDRTEHWLSRDVSSESDGDDGDDIGRPSPSGRVRSTNYDISMDALRMISPIRSATKSRPTRDAVSDDADDANAGASSADEDDDFHSPREVFGSTSKSKTPETTSSRKPSHWSNVRLVRAATRHDEQSHRGIDDSFDNSPDLRPPPSTVNRRSFAFTDDSESILVDDGDDDEFGSLQDDDEASLRSFILTGDEDSSGISASASRSASASNLRAELKSMVNDLALAQDGLGTPQRLLKAQSKIEQMLARVKRDRVRAGEFSQSAS